MSLVYIFINSDAYSCDGFMSLALYKSMASKIATDERQVIIVFVVNYPSIFDSTGDIDPFRGYRYNDVDFFAEHSSDLLMNFKKMVTCYTKTVSNRTLFSHVVYNLTAQIWEDVKIDNPVNVVLKIVDGGCNETNPWDKTEMQSTIHTYLQCLDRTHQRFNTSHIINPTVHEVIDGIDKKKSTVYMDINGPISFSSTTLAPLVSAAVIDSVSSVYRPIDREIPANILTCATINSALSPSTMHQCLSSLKTERLFDVSSTQYYDFQGSVLTLKKHLAAIIGSSPTLQRMCNVYYLKHTTHVGRIVAAMVLCQEILGEPYRWTHQGKLTFDPRYGVMLSSNTFEDRIPTYLTDDERSILESSELMTIDVKHVLLGDDLSGIETYLHNLMQRQPTTSSIECAYLNSYHEFEDDITMMITSDPHGGIPFTPENVIHFGAQFDRRLTFDQGIIEYVSDNTVLVSLGNISGASENAIYLTWRAIELKRACAGKVLLISGTNDIDRFTLADELLIVHKGTRALPWHASHESILHLALDISKHWDKYEFMYDSEDYRDAFNTIENGVKSSRWSKAHGHRYDIFRNSLNRVTLTKVAIDSMCDEILSFHDHAVFSEVIKEFRENKPNRYALVSVATMIMTRVWDFTPNTAQIHKLSKKAGDCNIDLNGLHAKYMAQSQLIVCFMLRNRIGTISSLNVTYSEDTLMNIVHNTELLKTRAVNALQASPKSSSKTTKCRYFNDFEGALRDLEGDERCNLDYCVQGGNRKGCMPELGPTGICMDINRHVGKNDTSFAFFVIPCKNNTVPYFFGISQLSSRKHQTALFVDNCPCPEGRVYDFRYNVSALEHHPYIKTMGNTDIYEQQLTYHASSSIQTYHLLNQDTVDKLTMYGPWFEELITNRSDNPMSQPQPDAKTIRIINNWMTKMISSS